MSLLTTASRGKMIPLNGTNGYVQIPATGVKAVGFWAWMNPNFNAGGAKMLVRTVNNYWFSYGISGVDKVRINNDGTHFWNPIESTFQYQWVYLYCEFTSLVNDWIRLGINIDFSLPNQMNVYDIRTFSSALTDSEIASLVSNTPAGTIPAKTIKYYDLSSVDNLILSNTQITGGNNATITPTQQRLVASTINGKVLQLDPTGNEHIQLANVSQLNLAGDYTQRLRFKLDAPSEGGVILSKGGGNASEIQWLLDIENGVYALYQGIDLGGGSYTYRALGNKDVEVGKWEEAIIIRNATTKTLEVNISGVSSTANWTSGVPVTYPSTGATIGAYATGVSKSKITVAQYTVWNTALTVAQVATEPTSGLVANYIFDGNVNCSNDSACNGFTAINNGIPSNSTRYIGNTSPYTTTLATRNTQQRLIEVAPVKPKSLTFAGSSTSYLKATYKAALISPVFSVTMKLWVRDIQTGGNPQYLFTNIPNDNAADQIGAVILPGGSVQFHVLGPPATINITAGTVNKIAVTYDGTIAKLYVNDVMVQATTIGIGNNSHGNDFLIGMLGMPPFYQYPLNGAIQDFIYWNRALSSTEIVTVHSKHVVDMTPTELTDAILAVNVASNGTITDKSTNNFTLTPFNVQATSII